MGKEIGIKADRLKIHYNPETGDITEQYNAEPIGKAATAAAAVEWCKSNITIFRAATPTETTKRKGKNHVSTDNHIQLLRQRRNPPPVASRSQV